MSALRALTDADFETATKESTIPILVDFWAPWCGPCQSLGPILEELSEELQGKLAICKMNVEENNQAPMTLGIRSIPTMIVFKNGQEVKRLVGAQGKAPLKEALLALL